MSNERKPYMSFSTAKKLLEYPLPIAVHKIHEERGEPNDAMVFGSVVDGMLLDEEALKGYVCPEGKDADGRTKEGKAFKAKAREEGLTVVRPETWQNARDCADSVARHPLISRSLNSLTVKTQLKLDNPIEGTPTVGYVDLWDEENGILYDLKTTNVLNFKDPSKTIFNNRWHLQLYMYRKGLRAMGYKGPMTSGWAVVLSEAPYHVEVWGMDEDWTEVAEKDFKRAQSLYQEYLDFIPDDCPVVRDVSPLSWML